MQICMCSLLVNTGPMALGSVSMCHKIYVFVRHIYVHANYVECYNAHVITHNTAEAVEQILVWGGGGVSETMTWRDGPKLGGSGGMPPQEFFKI